MATPARAARAAGLWATDGRASQQRVFLRAMLVRSTYARHRIRHGIRHTAALAGRRPRRCIANDPDRVKSPSRGSLIRQHRGLTTVAGSRRRRRSVGASSRVGRVRDCCDRLTARFGLIVALEAGEIGVQPAAAAIIVGSPARLIARRML